MGARKKTQPLPPGMFDPDRWYPANEIAERLSVSRDAVVDWGSEGKIRAMKIGRCVRYSGADLNEFMRPLGARAHQISG